MIEEQINIIIDIPNEVTKDSGVTTGKFLEADNKVCEENNGNGK